MPADLTTAIHPAASQARPSRLAHLAHRADNAGSARAAARAASPWWRHGHVWLVIAGPAVVVIACIVTIVIAVRQPDPVIATDYYRRGIEINQTLATREAAAKALLPAVQARNHAASPAPAEAPQAPAALTQPPQGSVR